MKIMTEFADDLTVGELIEYLKPGVRLRVQTKMKKGDAVPTMRFERTDA